MSSAWDIPGHQNLSFIKLNVWSRPWCPALQWQPSIAACCLCAGTTNTDIVSMLLDGVIFKESTMGSNPGIVHLVFSKTFSSRLRGSWLVFIGMGSVGFIDREKNPFTYSCATRAHCHSSGAVSISVSFSTWMTQSMIGVPTMKGPRQLNSLPSQMTKATCSSSYEYKARHAHKRLYTVLPKYSKIQVLPGITSCRLMKYNKQAIELKSLLINNMPKDGYGWG